MSPAKRQDLPAFQQKQYEFAAHIRDPEQAPRPSEVEDRRMAIYRELFFNNVSGILSDSFPVLRSITPDDTWQRRIRRFYADHNCHTPYFIELSKEFVDWLVEERGDHPDDPPFIRELAHYEWVEIALTTSDEDKDLSKVNHNGDLLDGMPLISPVAMHLAYEYPAHKISKDFQPQEPGAEPTYLVVYRDRQDQIHFLEINAVTYRLMSLIKELPQATGREILLQIAGELSHPEPEQVVNHGASLLHDLRERNIIIGTRESD